MGGILVIGESVVDRVITAQGDSTSRPGGSPANVAVGLGRLGETVTLITELGGDADGDLVRAHLQASHVTLNQQLVPHTSSAAATIGADGSATYEFDISWTLHEAPSPTGCAVVHVGSLGAVLAPGAAAVVKLLDGLSPDVLISYDPNIRAVMPLDSAAIEAMAGRAQLIKASDEDLALIYPGRSVADSARAWVSAGAQLVVVTAAAAGSVAYAATHEVHCPAASVEVVDTVGAGDAFMAALLHHLHSVNFELSTSEIGAALGFAARAAGIVCSRAGADPAWAAEL